MLLSFKKDNTDERMIAGLLQGGIQRNKTQTELYLRYDYLIRAGCRKYKMEEEKAASAYSEAVMAVIKNIITGKFEKLSSLETYISKIFWNKCVDELRTDSWYAANTRTEENMEELLQALPDNAYDIVSAHMKKQDWGALTGKLALLGKKCYDILMLWANHYRDQEIADIMTYSTAKAARVTRSRCLEKLQKEGSVIELNHE